MSIFLLVQYIEPRKKLIRIKIHKKGLKVWNVFDKSNLDVK